MDNDINESFIRSLEDVRADIGDPIGGTQELHQLKARTMELSLRLGLPHIESLWSRESGKYRYLTTVYPTKLDGKYPVHVFDTVTGAQYDDTL